MKNLKIFILAGGKGTRLWPLSRENFPKQFIKFFDSESLYRLTLQRALKIASPENIFIITAGEYEDLIKGETLSVNKKLVKNIICEPEGRNTLPAALLGCYKCAGEDVFIAMPSDHYIPDADAFKSDMKKSADAAKNGFFVTLGIVPDKPETGFGYIQADIKGRSKAVCKVKNFVEKPNYEKACEYLKKGGYYWNSGIFIFRAGEFLKAVKEFEPVLYKSFAKGEKHYLSNYKKLPSQSVDYGVMEKIEMEKVLMVPASFAWSDMGGFEAFYESSPKNKDKNVISGSGEVISIASKGNLFRNSGKLLVTVGLEDTIFVDTEDAVLIMKKGMGQKLKDVHQILKDGKKEEINYNKTGYRPWGSYTVILKGDRYKIKKITVNPGAALSMQKHYHRSEHWVVISGTAKVTLDKEVFFVHENESIYIPKSRFHRLENPGKVSLEIIEVQNGEYLEEDDIIRVDDVYGRE